MRLAECAPSGAPVFYTNALKAKDYNDKAQITRRTNPLGAVLTLDYMSGPGRRPADSAGFAGIGAVVEPECPPLSPPN